jgi:hypothetical protein
MATKTLTKNLFLGDQLEDGTTTDRGKWYGPDYPQNKVTAKVLERITNPECFEEAEENSPVDPHSLEARALRLAGEQGGYSDEELEDLNKADLQAIAAARGVEVPARASKAEILAALLGEE